MFVGILFIPSCQLFDIKEVRIVLCEHPSKWKITEVSGSVN